MKKAVAQPPPRPSGGLSQCSSFWPWPDSGLSAAGIRSQLELTAGTTNRILRALLADGLLARNPETDSYYLGSGAILLGQAAQRGFGLDKVHSVLEQLNSETDESVNLVVRDGPQSVVMLRVQSTLPLRFEQHPGARFPLYSTASGKAILAFSDDADSYLRQLPAKLTQLTPNTLSSPAKLAAQLKTTRVRGYSIDEEENVAGVRCVGAAVLDPDGRAHAALVIRCRRYACHRSGCESFGELARRAAKTIAQFMPVDRALSR